MWRNLGKSIVHYKFSLLTIVITFFLLGYFLCEFAYNQQNARYSYHFSTSLENVDMLKEETYFKNVLDQIAEHNAQVAKGEKEGKKIPYANIDYSEMLKQTVIIKEDDGYQYQVFKKYFPSLVRSSSDGTVNFGEQRCQTYLHLIFSYAPETIVFSELTLIHYQNPMIIGTWSSLTSLVILLVLFVLHASKKEAVIGSFEDNKTLFKTPFHKGYWIYSSLFFKKVKNISMIGILFALMMMCKLIPIPSGFGSLGLSFTYLIFAVIAMIYGPLCGLVIGFCSDIMGFFFFGGGPVFFPGYTLDAMLAGFVYGLCFYRTKVSFAKCLTARFLVNIFVNACLGSLWWKIVYGLDWNGFMIYFSFTSLPKNILYLLPQSALLYLLLKALAVPLARFGLIEEEVGRNISIF